MDLEIVNLLNAGAKKITINHDFAQWLRNHSFLHETDYTLFASLSYHCWGMTAYIFLEEFQGQYLLHRKKGPALLVEGDSTFVVYFNAGKLHRLNGFAAAEYLGYCKEYRLYWAVNNKMLQRVTLFGKHIPNKHLFDTADINATYHSNGHIKDLVVNYSCMGQEVVIYRYNRYGQLHGIKNPAIYSKRNSVLVNGQRYSPELVQYWFHGINVTKIVNLFRKI